ncbi:dUTP diphosphatase [Desulfopila sp. IMCC35008]|uniref:dUTP diphosphatase n=1 Tax=Desulfopila sp. IMCC35008 TaxID=2653858 RepID=UPI0013CFD406|nr:dUTP diphosphatase [Desulfopila sp. IMCC35008]
MSHLRNVEVEISWIEPQSTRDLHLPAYETSGSAGMDIEAAIQSELIIEPGQIVLIPTGFAVAIPAGYEFQIRPRSGLAVKHGLTIINSPGTIDSDYRGEVKIGLVHLGKEPFRLKRGDRVGQMILAPVVTAKWKNVESLDETKRGSGGFGHTGLR